MGQLGEQDCTALFELAYCSSYLGKLKHVEMKPKVKCVWVKTYWINCLFARVRNQELPFCSSF
jgi:hypothetical protein